MRVQDLQQFLSNTFTAANKDGSSDKEMLCLMPSLMVQVNGHLEKVVRMEVQENSTPIIGHKGHSAHRLVLKTAQPTNTKHTTKTANLSAVVTLKNIWAQRLNFIKMLSKTLNSFHLSGLKILAYLVLLIYWSVILLGTFVL